MAVALWHTAAGTRYRQIQMADQKLFRITFHNQGKIYEVYARKVTDAFLLGFVQFEDLVFGERSGVVVDPSEERLRDEFAGVMRSYIPMHSVIRVDEVTRHGPARISDATGGNVTPFPSSPYPAGGSDPGGKKR